MARAGHAGRDECSPNPRRASQTSGEGQPTIINMATERVMGGLKKFCVFTPLKGWAFPTPRALPIWYRPPLRKRCGRGSGRRRLLAAPRERGDAGLSFKDERRKPVDQHEMNTNSGSVKTAQRGSPKYMRSHGKQGRLPANRWRFERGRGVPAKSC
ncbi:uncharacterized protein [Narcine bancroftii]|uniref:uncharacterized protein isoform X1 n=1 Tax=Narcine bancroftii TaxID=1343680 RepID=UPI003831F64D